MNIGALQFQSIASSWRAWPRLMATSRRVVPMCRRS